MRKQKYTILGTLLALSISGTSNASEVSCVVQPTCESLGYTQAASACVDNNYTACPFDTAKVKCQQTKSCADLGYIYTSSTAPCEKTAKCPYDSAQLMCISNPVVGDFKYSFQTKDHKGWWKADGRYVPSIIYSSVYNLFGETFPSASKLSVLTPFIYAGVDYDEAYISYMETIMTFMEEAFDADDTYVDSGGDFMFSECPSCFVYSVDSNQNEILYENYSGPDTKETVVEKYLADKYVDEFSYDIYAYYDSENDYYIVGAHHDLSTDNPLDIDPDTINNLSSYFKITAADYVTNYASKNLLYAYAQKCRNAVNVINSFIGYSFFKDALCANSSGGLGSCAPTSTYTYTPYVLSSSTTTSMGSNGWYILEPSDFMKKVAKINHTLGVSGLQEGLHYFSMNTLGAGQAYLWDGSEGFTHYGSQNSSYTSYNIVKYGGLHPKLNLTVYPWASTPTSTSAPEYHWPTLHFYCIMTK